MDESDKAGNFVSWPNLTADTVQEHFPESEKTQKGHMHMLPQGIQSMKIRIKQENEEEECETRMSKKYKDVFVHVYDLNNDARKNLHQSDMTVPNKVKPREPVHHGHVQDG